MTTDKAKEILSRPFNMKGVPQDILEAHKMAIKALEQEPCEDAISRKAVEDAIYDYSRACDVNEQQIMEYIDKLPPIQPKEQLRIKARWIRDSKGISHCSKCAQGIFSCQEWFKYCPSCGVEMENEG